MCRIYEKVIKMAIYIHTHIYIIFNTKEGSNAEIEE